MAGQIVWVVEGMRCQCVYEVCVLVGVGEFLVSDLSTDGLISCISEAQNSNNFTFSPTRLILFLPVHVSMVQL